MFKLIKLLDNNVASSLVLISVLFTSSLSFYSHCQSTSSQSRTNHNLSRPTSNHHRLTPSILSRQTDDYPLSHNGTNKTNDNNTSNHNENDDNDNDFENDQHDNLPAYVEYHTESANGHHEQMMALIADGETDFKASLLNPSIGPIAVAQHSTPPQIPGADQGASRRGKALRISNELLEERPVVKKRPEQTDDVCMTPGCVIAAAEILKSMDDKVDPCEDFYQYSCGNWIDSQVIPEDRTSVSLFSIVTDELDNKLRNLIEKEPKNSDAPIVGKMRALYKSCTNITDIENRANEPLMNVINAMGGWPVLGDRNSVKRWTNVTSNYPNYWLELLGSLRKHGFSHDILIDLSVTPDFRNNTKHIIDVDQASLGMPDRSYLLKGINDSAVAAYFKLMVESAVVLGADEQEAKKQLMDVLQFETKLAEYSLGREDRANISTLYNKMNYTQLRNLTPEIDWIAYFNTLLPLSNETNSRPYNPDEDEVIVDVPSFMVNVSRLLNTTEPAVLTNYVMWRVVLQSISTLGKRWRELAHNYNAAITGKTREEPRWEQCLGSLSGTLGIALSSLYVRNYFKTESKKAAEEMVYYIRKEFMKILTEVDWMDEDTRKEALAKAEAISSYIGYPDELLNDELIEELYQGLDIGDNFFTNIQHLRRWSTDYSFNMLRKQNEKIDWKKHARAATVNAFYSSLDNSIEFPAGILQGGFYDKTRPNYLNFGAIGYIIGHEITHGFDNKGRQFDKDGNNRNWWNSETDQRFKDRAQCIIDQYSNYIEPESNIRLSGVNTQGENIADNGGLKEAFRAYNEWTKRNGEEPRLPGVNLTTRQLFWVSSANVWCGKFRPEVLKLRVIVGSHSPARFRITGPFSNLKEFSDTFNCPTNSTLNPTHKCSVW